MTSTMADEMSALRIYIDYEYLAAQQLGELLLGVHGLFDDLLYADAPYLRELPSAPAARLRIETVETGGSITVSVVHGITQLVGSADPALVSVTSGLAALVATGSLVLRLLNRAEDLRAKWLRDHRIDEHHKLELADKQLDVIGKGLELRALAETAQSRQLSLEDTKAVLAEQAPNRPPDQQDALAERLKPHLDAIAQIIYDDNIRRVSITLPRHDG